MDEEQRRREAERALDRVARDSETVGASSLSRVGRRVGDHFAGRDGGETDPIEVWGRRIGRALSLVGLVALTYWLGLQLGWWR